VIGIMYGMYKHTNKCTFRPATPGPLGGLA